MCVCVCVCTHTYVYTDIYAFMCVYIYVHTWASLVAQIVNSAPAMQKNWVPSLGWEDLLEERMATHSSTVAWRMSTDRRAWQATVHGVAKRWTRLSD